MRIEIHHYHHIVRDAALLRSVLNLETRMATIMRTLDDLLTQGTAVLGQVRQNGSLDESIIALVTAQASQLTDLRAQLAAAGNDPAKLAKLGEVMDQLSDQLRQQGQATADAVTANTHAASDAATAGTDASGGASGGGTGTAATGDAANPSSR